MKKPRTAARKRPSSTRNVPEAWAMLFNLAKAPDVVAAAAIQTIGRDALEELAWAGRCVAEALVTVYPELGEGGTETR